MILDNLTRALRTQNWLAAGIEFVIVIAGVVIGFQIQGWAEGREDLARAERYVADIRADIEADLAMYGEIRATTARRREAAEAVLAAIETGRFDAAALFVRQVDMAGRYSPPAVQRAAYDDLVATGGLRLIEADRRERIVAYYRDVQREETGFELQRRRIFDDYLPLAVAALPLEMQRWIYDQLGAPLTPDDDAGPAHDSAVSVLARLSRDEAAATALKAVVRGTWSMAHSLDVMERDARALLDILAAEEPR